MQPQTSGPNSADPRLVSSASWLYWVAGMSAINTVIQLSGGSWSFSMGLGLTQILTSVGDGLGPMAKTITLGATIVVIVMLAFLGYMACRGAIWAFIIGIVILVLDTLPLFVAPSELFISIAVHIWAIISLVIGVNTAIKIRNGTYSGGVGP